MLRAMHLDLDGELVPVDAASSEAGAKDVETPETSRKLLRRLRQLAGLANHR